MPLRIFSRVLHALILREMTGRFGESRAGYLWAILNPVASIMALYWLYSLVRDEHAGMPMLVFIVTGWVTYDFYQQMMARIGSALDANKGLMMHAIVTRLDIIIARAALEGMTFIAMLIIFMSLATAIEDAGFPVDPLLILTAFLTAGALGLSFGLLLAALKTYFPFAENFISPINRIGLLVSGVILTARDLPSWTWDYIKWIPTIHPVEGMRQGWFSSYQSPILDLGYTWSIILPVVAISLVIERRSRHAVSLG